MRCSNCDKPIFPHAASDKDRTDFVEVKARTEVTTAFEGGYPSGGHLATTFAGVYCSLQCAGDHLSDHLAARAKGSEEG